MTVNDELNELVYEKLCGEQREYVARLMNMAPEAMLRKSYEYCVRSDILAVMENTVLSDRQCRAALTSPDLLGEIYTLFNRIQTGYVSDLKWCIEHAVNVHAVSEGEDADERNKS